ncbi:MAG TPA: hypothetical protein VN754_05060, partial [Candidatus Binataceae bacterium]|nr:hypothetical protein [Candidatus Binataceae bacterium]
MNDMDDTTRDPAGSTGFDSLEERTYWSDAAAADPGSLRGILQPLNQDGDAQAWEIPAAAGRRPGALSEGRE